MKTGVATFEQVGEDRVALSWEAPDGSAVVVPMSLREAADLQAGKPVSGYGEHRITNPQRRTALAARNEGIEGRMGELEDQYPQLRDNPPGGAP